MELPVSRHQNQAWVYGWNHFWKSNPDDLHYLQDGRIVYSHIDSNTSTSSLWTHDYGFVLSPHDRTSSDGDPYPDKHNFNHIAFIGWENDGYNLFMYRQMSTDSVRPSQGLPMLAPVLFRQTRRYPECDGVP